MYLHKILQLPVPVNSIFFFSEVAFMFVCFFYAKQIAFSSFFYNLNDLFFGSYMRQIHFFTSAVAFYLFYVPHRLLNAKSEISMKYNKNYNSAKI